MRCILQFFWTLSVGHDRVIDEKACWDSGHFDPQVDTCFSAFVVLDTATTRCLMVLGENSVAIQSVTLGCAVRSIVPISSLNSSNVHERG
jgi:hypothetical protein